MNPFNSSPTPVWTLLPLGARGVGKTVFLVGSYAELHGNAAAETFSDWTFECQDSQDWQNLQTILDYIGQKGNYPPPTMKFTDFTFSLHRRQRREKTLATFCWSDLPGEKCDFQDPQFQNRVLASHSCCVFINADRLVKEPDYNKELDLLRRQIGAIAHFLEGRHLPYAFAIILTQCDRLDPGVRGRLQIAEKLQDFLSYMHHLKVKYREFFCSIPLVSTNGHFKLEASGAADAFLWLLSELKQAPKHQSLPSLEAAPPAKKRPRIALHHWVLPLAAAAIGFGAIAVVNEQAFTRWLEPDDDSLVEQVYTHLEAGQLAEAIPLLEKIVQRQPEVLSWQLSLAYSYEGIGNLSQAEATYDRLLTLQPKHVDALLGKAMLRYKQGDLPAAKRLLQQAEEVADSQDLKARLRELKGQLLEQVP